MKKNNLIIILTFAIHFSLIAQNWTTYSKVDGLIYNRVISMCIDNSGNKWFGTNKGVSMFNGESWFSYPMNESNVLDIAKDAKGNIWFATTFGNGIYKFDGITWTNYTMLKDGLLSSQINCIAIDVLDNKWFGSLSGVAKFDDISWITYTKADGLIHNVVIDIAIDSKGNKWFATFNGISEFDGTTWKKYTMSDGLVSNYVYCVKIDAHDNKWFGTDSGISKFDGTTWTTYNINNGLPNNIVFDIAFDNFGNNWFATNGGVAELDGANWIYYNVKNGLVNDTVTEIIIDSYNNKWFCTVNGISKFNEFGQSIVTQIKKSSILEVTPNPTTGIFHVILDKPFESNFLVEVYNISGNLIHSEYQNKTIIEFEINLSQYMSGQYLLKIYSNECEIHAKVLKR